MNIDTVFEEMQSQMDKTLEHTLHEFAGIHTGKATPAMLENIPVEVYGSSMRIREVAAITCPDSRSLSVQPWDKGTTGAIQKAIQTANIGLNPVVNGTNIFCPLPELSGERRKDLVKTSHNLAEQGRVGIRSVRRDAMEKLKQLEKDKAISEDELKRGEKNVQEEHDRYIKEIATHLEAKEKDLLAI